MVRQVSGDSEGFLIRNEGKENSLNQLSQNVNKIGQFVTSQQRREKGVSLEGHVTQVPGSSNLFSRLTRQS